MNRIDKLFQEKKNNIFSVYFTAGYPELDDTVKVIQLLEDNGVDMLEIGVPFSDPMADGPVIQSSGSQALKNGMSLKLLFNQLSNVRQSVSIPLVLMSYLNPIIQFGFEDYCKEAVKCGIDGLIIPDLPFDEYMESYKSIAEEFGLHVIMLVTPETSEERIRLIDQNTSGFIYMVSSASVTGAKNRFSDEVLAYFRHVDEMQLNNPRLIGFGISNKETFEAACRESSGVIIGSKFISLLGSESSIDDAIKQLIFTIDPK
ncbi:MAG: tryptophan synthase subunit alpha [Fermentimonas sp.]|jgi:tryptophan synthase alpha chain|nr:tryptophan synthase subunit alpha [Fermentimonas sp.]HBT84355.1 tryptophan synthase subunit alpha [Porphyromonadaceae bacterium]MDD2930220.1 tryptophan synthase subunit alpha [Fermentimonas sp.]MDD3188079.1 tryptophan synthase subunit alpha [Fermentimonas sp.]MDD3510816.1 tryptophan synthase subunit alpha [Fermentimonas sp.]